ncbi:MAG TPA: hypothetical protein VFR03_15045 [Thermoanaerobaculia bacterium]|nr:hypothetical protein [Thermoanaerobaculia bacterium]
MAVFDRSVEVEPEPPDAMPVEEGQREAAAPDWGQGKRILFRFTFSYLFLYLMGTGAFLGLLAFIPYGGIVVGWYFELWSALVPWVGRHLFQAAATSHPTGSGDTMYKWVEIFCYLALAGVATLVWTAVDRKRKSYPRLYEWLRVYVRLGLGMTMLSYGAFKVIPSQFPAPSLDRLLQSFGDSSPMGILWTFMGASAPYTIFAGLAEFAGGALLLFRRTMRLGALVTMAAMTNVVALNFCYDVPVKQYSSHLLAMAVFLAAPDLRRLADLLVFHRAVPAIVDPPLFRRRWPRRAALALETVLLLGYGAYMLNVSYQQYREYHDVAGKPLHGIWRVDELAVDGQVRPLVVADDSRWRYVVLDYSDLFSIMPMDGTRQRYFAKLDTGKKTIALKKRDDPAWKSNFNYQEPAPGRLTLEGTFDGRKVRASLHRIETPRFQLHTRGFHWVSEYPFNR